MYRSPGGRCNGASHTLKAAISVWVVKIPDPESPGGNWVAAGKETSFLFFPCCPLLERKPDQDLTSFGVILVATIFKLWRLAASLNKAPRVRLESGLRWR